MKLNLDSRPPGNQISNRDFLQLSEDHISYYKNSIQTVSISPLTALKYKGDFYGLLDTLSVDISRHYITLRINNLRNSLDYKGDSNTINLLSESTSIII